MKSQSIALIVAVVLFAAAVYTISPSITGFLTRTGEFTVGNEAVVLQAVFLNNQELTDIATDVTITGVENTTKGIIIKVWVEDQNGNCDEFTSGNGTAYFCDGDGVACDAFNAKHSVTDLEYDAGDGQWGSSNEYCNLTGSSEDWYFFEVSGAWTVNITVTDGETTSDWDDARWTWNEIRAITYPASGSTVDLGALTINEWNNGTGQALMQNSGNIILNLDWNATDFTGQSYADSVEIDGTNFAIDDDPLSPADGDPTKIDDMTALFYDYSKSATVSETPPDPDSFNWDSSDKSEELYSADDIYADTVILPRAGEYGYVFQLFEFPRSAAEAITLHYKGYVEMGGAGGMSLNIWDEDAGSYELLATLNGTNTEYEINLTSQQIEDGLFNGKIYFMIAANDGQDQSITIYSDYIEISELITSQDEVFINDNPLTTIAYEPASGLLNCSSVACSNQNATKDIYWHLQLPLGIRADTYTDTIEVSTSDWTNMRLPGGPGGGGPV